MSDRVKRTGTLGELMGLRQQPCTCPQCHQPVFFVQNTYYLVDGTKRRLRKCRFCGFPRSEDVPEPRPVE